MLTNAAIQAARARAHDYKIADGAGLYLLVRPNGRRTFRLKYRFDGTERLLTIGHFPETSLSAARAACDAARAQLRQGGDPAARAGAPASATGSTPTFEQVARDWHAQRRARWSAAHAGDVLDSLARHVFPAIGAQRLADIDAPALLALLETVEAGGAFETARRLRQRISAVFGFAITRKLAVHDPAAILARELGAAPAVRHHAALLELADVRQMLAAADAAIGATIVKQASRFLALTAVRLAALRGAEWHEFEGIDWSIDAPTPAALWRIPPARMKLAAAKKGDSRFEHLVPLAPAAVALLRDIRAGAGGVGPVFRGRGAIAPIGETAIGALYARAGFAGRHTPHGWRAAFSTILNEALPDHRDAIDRALAHAPKDKVEAAYNRAAHLARRRFLFERWAEMLAG